MIKTKKHFENLLNESEYKHKQNRYGNRTRSYGTYLRKQDPIKFNVNYIEWLEENN